MLSSTTAVGSSQDSLVDRHSVAQTLEKDRTHQVRPTVMLGWGATHSGSSGGERLRTLSWGRRIRKGLVVQEHEDDRGRLNGDRARSRRSIARNLLGDKVSLHATVRAELVSERLTYGSQ